MLERGGALGQVALCLDPSSPPHQMDERGQRISLPQVLAFLSIKCEGAAPLPEGVVITE